MVCLYSMTDEERIRIDLSCCPFVMHYHGQASLYALFRQMTEIIPNYSVKELWAIVENSWRTYKLGGIGLSVHKTRKSYTANKQKLSPIRVYRMLDYLCEQDYLVFHKGGILKWDNRDCSNNKTITSKYIFQDKFIEMLKQYQEIHLTQQDILLDNPVVATQERIIPAGVSHIIAAMNKLNQQYLDSAFGYGGTDIVSPQYRRIFGKDTDEGGRIYCVDSSLQTMPYSERKSLSINGEPICELDFKAMHLSLLYDFSSFGKHWELSTEFSRMIDDPYNIDISHILQGPANEIRVIIKKMILIALNASNFKQAAAAMFNDYRNNLDRLSNITYDGKQSGSARGFPCRMLAEAVLESYPSVAGSFYTGCGMRLQRVESDIVINSLCRLSEDGIVGISEHDSIIIGASHKDKAICVMKEEYLNVVGHNQFCKIEEK